MKTIGLQEDTYQRLFQLQVRLQLERGKRVTFSELVDELLENYEKKE